MENKAHGIMFHHFHDDGKHIKGQGSIDKDQFRRMVLWLREHYNILSAIDWYEKSNTNTLNNNDICITFDDNLLCQHDIALPVLEEFDIQAFWFVYSSPLVGVKEKLEVYRYFRFSEFNDINEFYKSFDDAIEISDEKENVSIGLKEYDSNEYLSKFPFYTEEDKKFRFIRGNILGQKRYYKIMDQMVESSNLIIDTIIDDLWMSKEQIKYLHDTKHVIGLHSHTHPTDLGSLSYDQQEEQYQKNRDILEGILGDTLFTVSHPCNSYDENTLDLLTKMGIGFGFRANMEEGFISSLEYPRIDHTLLIKHI